MTTDKQVKSVDDVLAEYAQMSDTFDGKALQACVEKYPTHVRALHRYARIQLTSVRATQEDVDKELPSDDEMLPLQSKLLERLRQMREEPSAVEVDSAVARLSSISGSEATTKAAVAVFGSCMSGEDVLLLTVVEADQPVQGTPAWFHRDLGTHLSMPGAVVEAAIAKRRHLAKQRRFSAKSKPVQLLPIMWRQAVEDCITSAVVRKAILERPDSA